MIWFFMLYGILDGMLEYFEKSEWIKHLEINPKGQRGVYQSSWRSVQRHFGFFRNDSSVPCSMSLSLEF